MNFREYVKDNLLKKDDRILEFGPLIRPLVSKEQYPNVVFADVRSTDEIKKLYTSNNYLEATGLNVDISQVAEIDYVINKSYSETFKNAKKFDVIYLSHVIEHMPDIIGFFQDVKNVLSDKGKLVLIYPDARYCFDHFRNGTTFVDAYEVYIDKKNSSKRVLDFVYNVVNENDATFFWNKKNQNDILPTIDLKKTLGAYDKAMRGELPDDTHFWPFSDFQFVKFLYDMDRANMLDFEIVDFYETQINTQEFMIILEPKKKKQSIRYDAYRRILNQIDPVRKNIIAKETIDNLRKDLYEIRHEYDNLNKELKNIVNSKKWQYANKISKLKNIRRK